MNLTVNAPYIARNRRQARLTQIIGLALVLISLGLSIAMSSTELYWLVFVAYPTLIVGFPLWQAGRGRVRRWDVASKLPAVVRDEIQPGPKQQLYSYIEIGKTLLDHLLVTPEGLFVIELKGLTDDPKGRYPVGCRQVAGVDRWRQALPPLERLARLGESALGNPSADLTRKLAALKEWLAAKGLGETIPVYGLVVFREAATPLDIEACQYEVLHLNEIRSFLTLGQYFDETLRPLLGSDDRNRINAALRALLGLSPTPQVVKAVAPVRKLSPEARAEQERVAAIRAARVATPPVAAADAKTPARRAPGPPTPLDKPSAPGPRKGAG